MGEPCVQKKPSGEEAARLTIFFWGSGGGCAGPLGDTSSVEPEGNGTGAKSFFPLVVGECAGSDDGPPSLAVLESEARLSVEPVVKLTWTPLKDGLRLSAEPWLTFSKSELLLFIFKRCLDFGGGGGGEKVSILLLSLGNSKAKEADLLMPVLALPCCPEEEEPSVGCTRCQVEALEGAMGPFSVSLPQL